MSSDPILKAAMVKREPLPLTRATPSELPYPKDALLSLKSAVDAIQAKVQSPYPMCANSVLAAVTLAVQGHANIQMPVGSPKPLSNYFITIGRSGERKSASDDMALSCVAEREKELRDEYEIQYNSWRNEKDAWDQERKRILGKNKLGREAKTLELSALGAEPKEPAKPILTFGEPTYQGLIKYLEHGQPSVGVFSAEGGQFVGGHAMKEDNKTESAAGFNQLWDGTPVKRIRVIDGCATLPGRRLALHIMVQPDVASKLLKDRTLEDIGFLARTLITYPASTQGTRFHRELPQSIDQDLQAYRSKLSAILRKPLPLKENTVNILEPRTLELSQQAKNLWIQFDTETEKHRGMDGFFSTLAGLANKLPEHATRLAGVLALYEDITADVITERHLEAGIELVQYYAQEALRIKDIQATDTNLVKAEKLFSWIKEKAYDYLPLSDVYQYSPLRELRNAKAARDVMHTLQEHGYLDFVEGGYEINGKQFKEVWKVTC